MPKGDYKQIAMLGERWISTHAGETFDLERICRNYRLDDPVSRDYMTQWLSYQVNRTGLLEKKNRIYTIINKDIDIIDWVSASDSDILDLGWPMGHEGGSGFGDDSEFDFTKHLVVSPGDIHVIAGVTNMGKTAWCMNFLWENMDRYPCNLMGNEYVAAKFKRRAGRMDWRNPLKDDGTPKFKLIKRRDQWKYAIDPDAVNIIDWINLAGDKSYDIGEIIEGIQDTLREGMALISIQKNAGNDLGRGGAFSIDLSSLYMTLDYGKLTIMKAKEWTGVNPNGKIFGFEIVNGGTMFHRIREIVKCRSCWGKGYTAKGNCEECDGTGFADR